MRSGWLDAFAVLSATHEADFEAACEEAICPLDATVIPHPFLRVRVRNPEDETILWVALPDDFGPRCRVEPGRYVFPPEWAPEIRRIVSHHDLRASVVPSVRYHLELRDGGALRGLCAALLRRAPTFGPTYPRITAA
ncbi:MAG: hypothetical protein ICV73_13355 [Acetobacteraceae bacterium]|nr:hypothetical protein [Acetobacteraceae bacterium]